MNKIKSVIESRTEPVLNIYFTAGYPELDSTAEILKSLDRHGADLIEVGMPYSDPMADGPVIQKSSARALKNGLTLEELFAQIGEVQSEIRTPLMMMGYLNQMMRFGEERFLDAVREAGVSGLIIPDLPPELYAAQYRDLFEEKDVKIIFLITPQTSETRIRYIDSLSDSFIYAVSDSSVTGGTGAMSEAQLAYFRRIRGMNLNNPVLIGFGISDHRSFSQVAEEASGAIIGSAFIKTLETQYQSEPIDEIVRKFIKSIKEG